MAIVVLVSIQYKVDKVEMEEVVVVQTATQTLLGIVIPEEQAGVMGLMEEEQKWQKAPRVIMHLVGKGKEVLHENLENLVQNCILVVAVVGHITHLLSKGRYQFQVMEEEEHQQ